MKDSYNREIDYLRISVTDRCNLRCVYCMPETGIETVSMDEILSFEEIVVICEAAAELGIKKLKITGGEPLVRKDVPTLVRMLHDISGIEQVTLTTNGILLDKYIDELVDCGLDGVNISIDSLDPERYKKVTRVGNLEEALKGLNAAINSGIKVKTNSVLYAKDDWKQIVALAKDNDIDVKFIETMPIGMGDGYSGVFKEEIFEYFRQQGVALDFDADKKGNGPAIYFKPEGYKGNIGIIAPIHGKFCTSCNRIRLSATGMIKPCLCFKDAFDVKSALRGVDADMTFEKINDKDVVRNGVKEAVCEVLKKAILAKPEGHKFNEKEHVTETRCMSAIGG